MTEPPNHLKLKYKEIGIITKICSEKQNQRQSMGSCKDQGWLDSEVSLTQNILKSLSHPVGEKTQEIPGLTFKLV